MKKITVIIFDFLLVFPVYSQKKKSVGTITLVCELEQLYNLELLPQYQTGINCYIPIAKSCKIVFYRERIKYHPYLDNLLSGSFSLVWNTEKKEALNTVFIFLLRQVKPLTNLDKTEQLVETKEFDPYLFVDIKDTDHYIGIIHIAQALCPVMTMFFEYLFCPQVNEFLNRS